MAGGGQACKDHGVTVEKLSGTDGFVVVDLDDATASVGIVRLAPKVLRDGAELLARTVTYAFAAFGVSGQGGASAAINAKPEARDDAVAAFVDEVRPRAESGALVLSPGVGLEPDDLAPLGLGESPTPASPPRAPWPPPRSPARSTGAPPRWSGPAPWPTPRPPSSRRPAPPSPTPGSTPPATCCSWPARPASSTTRPPRACRRRSSCPLTSVPVTARALAVLKRAGRTVVPDFLSTAAPLLAAHDAEGGDPVQRVRDATIALAEAGDGMWLAAADQAEANLAGWTDAKPFGRPLA